MEFVYFIRQDLVQHHGQEAFTRRTCKRNRISMSAVGCRSCWCTCRILNTYCQESDQVLFDIHQAIRYPRQHASLARIKGHYTTFHSAFHGQPITTSNEISSLTQVYYVISTTITKHPNMHIIRCITLWAMGSIGGPSLGKWSRHKTLTNNFSWRKC